MEFTVCFDGVPLKNIQETNQMLSRLLKVSLISSALLTTSVYAQDATNGDWTISAFKSQTVEMAIATDKKTGHKMQVIKMKNGEMMALVAATPLWALMKDRALGDEANP